MVRGDTDRAQAGLSADGVSVGIPVYNEEQLLEPNLQRLSAHLETLGLPWEILVGSNGSTDGTRAIGERLAAARDVVRFFHLPERSVGAAFRRFLADARYDKLVSVDMDLSVDLGFIGRAVALLEEHDVVVGSKQAGDQRRSWVRRAGSATFVAVARAGLGLGIEDFSMAAKAYRVSALRPHAHTLVDGTAYVLDAVVAVHRAGGSVTQIPVDCDDRRRSRFNLLHEALHKFGHLARHCLSRR